MPVDLKGVMSALLTPFDSEQKLDKESLRRLVRFNIEQGIDGLYVGGSTGEAFVQSAAERESVLEVVADEAKGRLKLIAHVGCVSTAESQYLAGSQIDWAMMLFRLLRLSIIPSLLKNIANIIVPLLSPRMDYQWLYITFRH